MLPDGSYRTIGDDGDDTLIGGKGADMLQGGLGNNVLVGGCFGNLSSTSKILLIPQLLITCLKLFVATSIAPSATHATTSASSRGTPEN